MSYKYLYALLRSGLYDEFFEEIETGFVCYRDAEEYGKNPMENSSFIATSNHLDPKKIGRGFMPRLTGANAEMLSIWVYMMTGGKPFFTDENGELCFTLKPLLRSDYFDASNEVGFRLFSSCDIRLVNPERRDTYRAKIDKITVDGKSFDGSVVRGEYAEKIRDGKVKEIKVFFVGN